MPNRSKPINRRRGRGAGRDETWPTFLIDGADGGIGAVSRELAALDDVGDVVTDVTGELVSGTLVAPHGRWELLVQLRGQRWLILTRSGAVSRGWEQEALALSERLSRPVIAAGDDGPGQGVQFLVADSGEELIEFVSHGEKFSLRDVESGSPQVPGDHNQRQARQWATRFRSDRHDEDWWRKQPTTKSLDLLLRELEAFLPVIVREKERLVAKVAADEDVLNAVERIDLLVFGEKGRTKGRPTSLLVSNLDLGSQTAPGRPRHQKVFQPRWGVSKLVEFVKNEPAPESGIRPVVPSDFTALFELYSAEELVIPNLLTPPSQ